MPLDEAGVSARSAPAPRQAALYEGIAEVLRESIASGRVAPGTVILEGPVAEIP